MSSALSSQNLFFICTDICKKGRKRTNAELHNNPDFDGDDEIELHIRGIYLCSMDAMWRLMKKILNLLQINAAVKYHTSQGKWCDIQ